MEKGPFHTSVKSVIEMDDFVETLPLPNQMPRSLDFTKIPIEALRTSAVESLIGQNTDLMARLGVSLRKSGALEEKLTEMEKENLHLRHRYDAVKDQVLVIQEKERLLSDRSSQISVETDGLRERMSALEHRYVEIYTHSQNLERQVRRLRTYRYRVQQATENLRKKAATLSHSVSAERGQTKSLMSSIEQAERELKNIRAENNVIRAENSDAQLQLVSRYEADIAQTRAEMELLRRRAADRDVLYETKIRIENQLVFSERQATLYRDETQRDLQSTKEENQDLRGQLKARLIEVERLGRELSVALDRIEATQAQDKEKVDQIESLQLLWKEKQGEVERLDEKMRSLQKLNQQLSVNLNAQRKEIVDLKAEAEKERFLAQEKIRALETQLK